MGSAFTHERFISTPSHALHVSMLQAEAFAAWCAHDRESGRILALFAVHHADMPSADKLPRDPGSASCVVLPEWSVLVPNGALKPGSEPLHLRATFGREPLGVLRKDALDVLDAQSIHVHEPAAESLTMTHLPAARPLALQALLVRTALSRRGDRDLLLLHFGHDRMEAVLAAHGTVLLSNSYPVRTPEDALYFALLAAERTKRLPNAVQLCYSGPLANDNVIALLERYFPQCAPASGHELPGVDRPDRWLALTEQFACV